MKNRECVAMLLAGGKGCRLGPLTKYTSKPAVCFGGRYRIIDFPLSNCINSGIDTVGVLTQYQPLELSDYIGSGKAWDLDRLSGGVHILPPHQKNDGAMWYKGTANAIYQNLSFIERYSPKYVLILSGDHIYKMDYSKMLKAHIESSADCTISVIEVPKEEASRFGIMNVNESGEIIEFEEKPKKPKSNLASMGIYIFNFDVLKKFLTEDEENKNSSNDFGKDIIPSMLNERRKLFAYRFAGYWKDVGTIESLWEANMDLLSPAENLAPSEGELKIYSNFPASAPQYIGKNAKVQNSLITAGCNVLGEIESSVLFGNVTVEKGAKVAFSLLLPGAVVESGSTVEYAIIGENCKVKENEHIGISPERAKDLDSWGITVIGE